MLGDQRRVPVSGWPADYDRWAALGNPGWSFADLLPTPRAVEADADFADQVARGGRADAGRASLEELAPLQRAFLDAAVAVGHRMVEDHNRPGAVGVGPAPRNVRDGVRMSTALTYLAAARTRPNLGIRADAVVDRILLSGRRATGVRLAGGDVVFADRVVLAAGSYASPAILLRSGVGPASQLSELDLPVVADLRGVGANLVDHPLVAVDLPCHSGYSGPRYQLMLTMRSPLAAAGGPPDLHLFAAGPFDAADSPSGGVFGIVTGLLSVHSRGSLRLRSSSPTDPAADRRRPPARRRGHGTDDRGDAGGAAAQPYAAAS